MKVDCKSTSSPQLVNLSQIKRTNPKKGCFVPRNDATIME